MSTLSSAGLGHSVLHIYEKTALKYCLHHSISLLKELHLPTLQMWILTVIQHSQSILPSSFPSLHSLFSSFFGSLMKSHSSSWQSTSMLFLAFRRQRRGRGWEMRQARGMWGEKVEKEKKGRGWKGGVDRTWPLLLRSISGWSEPPLLWTGGSPKAGYTASWEELGVDLPGHMACLSLCRELFCSCPHCVCWCS